MGSCATPFPRVIREVGNDAAVDVPIITGSDPAFCAGLDLKELSSGEHDISESVGGDQTRQGPLPRIGKPIIGAINGVAVTGGFELALNCDFLVPRQATFAC
jgi:enoyl-CoA hydratase